MIRKFTRLAPLAALALAITACSGGGEPPESDANLVEAPVVENMGFENMVEPVAPTATPTPTPTPTDEPSTPVEAQVFEDADAVGMTARVNRDEAPADPATPETAPVEEKK